MKELILSLYNNILYYKINFIKKYCIIYVKKSITKSDIKYIFKHIFKIKLNNNFKVKNIIDKKKSLKKYYILFK